MVTCGNCGRTLDATYEVPKPVYTNKYQVNVSSTVAGPLCPTCELKYGASIVQKER
jgi:hypothetical protein